MENIKEYGRVKKLSNLVLLGSKLVKSTELRNEANYFISEYIEYISEFDDSFIYSLLSNSLIILLDRITHELKNE